MEVAEMKEKWVGLEFDVAEFRVSERSILGYAEACGEVDARFCDPSHPDFQAPPTYPARFVSRRIMPEEFPSLGTRVFDAGKCVTAHRPIRAGESLTAHSKIADIYEKTGRSGLMIFIVHRMEFFNPKGELASVVDWRLVRAPDQ